MEGRSGPIGVRPSGAQLARRNVEVVWRLGDKFSKLLRVSARGAAQDVLSAAIA